MAPSLNQIIYELKGQVRWIASTVISQSNTSKPGKLCLSQLGDCFYVQLRYDYGRKSRNYKLDVNQLIEAKLIERNGQFTLCIPQDNCTRLIVREADDIEIENFISYLNDIKRQVMSKAASRNKRLIMHVDEPIPRVGSIMVPEADTTSKQRLGTAVQRHALQNSVSATSPLKKVTQNKVKFGPWLSSQSCEQTPKKTPATVPRLLSHPNNQQKQVQKSVSERKNSQRRIRAHEEELEKENFFIDSDIEADISCTYETPHKKNSFKENEPLFSDVGLSENKIAPDNHESELWSTYETPKKKPLQESQENESSPQLSRSNQAKAFYGSSSKSIRVKRRTKTPVIRRSVLNVSPSSGNSPIARHSSLSFSPSAPTNSVKRPSLSSYSSFADTEVTSQGFTNLGNTCYMNAILQSILGLFPFVQELDNNDILTTVGQMSLYTCMYNLFRCKNEDGSSKRKKNALRKLKYSISRCEASKRFSGHLQNDAHEFMNICLDQMKEEVQKSLGEKSEDIAAKVCPVVRNFEGSLRKYIRCKGCKDLASKDELFNHLSLNIPRSSHSPTKVNLTKLLGRFFQEEELERTCEKCECDTAVQHLEILTLPRVLILHLIRSEYRRGTQEKNSDRIQVDRYLELGEFCSSDISGPPPFISKKTSSSKPHFTENVTENETPSADEDFVNFVKPRRRLDMSAAEHLSYSDEKPKKSRSSSQSTKKYPDWVNLQAKPTLSSSFTISDSSDDDPELKQAKLASLRDKQSDSSEEKQIKLAKLVSLKRKETADFSEEDTIEQAKLASLGLETKQQEEFKSHVRCIGVNDVSDAEMMEIAENYEQSDAKSSSKKNSTNSNTRHATNGVDPSNADDGNNCSQSNTESCSRKRCSFDSNDTAADGIEPTNHGGNGVETPSKRRKVEEPQMDKKNEIEVLDDEESQLKRVLELSKKEHYLSHSVEKAHEQSQMEEAIKRSLEIEDDWLNATFKDLEGMMDEVTGQGSEPEKTEEKQMPSGDVSYGLASVVSHVGSSASVGHYISDVYEVQSNQWTRYDDIHATKVKEYNVRYDNKSDGYIYFYMHKDCINNLLNEKLKES